jgi:hypothetical protein
MYKVYLTAVLFSLPIIVSAAGLVPCGGPGESPCQFCHTVLLVENISGWLVAVLGVIAAIVIAVMGLRLAASTGDTSAVGQVKKVIANIIVGYMILLGGWFLVDFGLKLLVNVTVYDKWDADVIECVNQPTSQRSARPSAVAGNNDHNFNGAEVSSSVAAINSSGNLQADIQAAAAAAGITDPAEINTLRALISQESSNCTNKTGPETSFGTAYGCGQILVNTARGLDPSLNTMTDAEVAKKLVNDDAYNLTLSAKYYGQLLNKYENETDLALAAYNGGFAANQASADCPATGNSEGLRKWECVWDSPGCHGTGETDCMSNEGANSYAQTRHYVSNINAVAGEL